MRIGAAAVPSSSASNSRVPAKVSPPRSQTVSPGPRSAAFNRPRLAQGDAADPSPASLPVALRKYEESNARRSRGSIIRDPLVNARADAVVRRTDVVRKVSCPPGATGLSGVQRRPLKRAQAFRATTRTNAAGIGLPLVHVSAPPAPRSPAPLLHAVMSG